jgi:hypothetical protein
MSQPAKHVSSSFDIAPYALKNDVLMMSSLTDRFFRAHSKGCLIATANFATMLLQKMTRSTFLKSKSIKTG